MKHFYPFLFLLLSCSLSFGQKLQGVVLDASTNERLPSVSVLYNASKKLGTTTDASGEFTIEDRSQIVRIEITFIGYKPVVIDRRDIPATGKLIVEMEEENTQLEEATVKAGENPALRIIRNAIAHSDKHDPKKYNTYQYKSYSKNILTKKTDSTPSAVTQLAYIRSDSSDSQLNRYLMIAETVSLIRSKKPDLYKEKILGTRISGFKNSLYAVGAENINYFGLYDNVIQVLTEYYVTPLADGADKKYFYIPEDTIVRGSDTTYILYYQPKIKANFEGLKGKIHINTHGWAIEYVSAEPYYKSTIDFAIEQYYTRVNDTDWFPQSLYILMQVERMPIIKGPGYLYSELHVDSAQLNISIPDKEFDFIKRELSEDAPYVKDEFWEKYRAEELNSKELETYEHMDSIGKRYKFDFLMGAARNIYRGFFTLGPLELKVNRFVNYNRYEGLRLGAGIYTSPLFSKKIRFGGYADYGLKDYAWKYGGTFEYFFNHKYDNKLTLDFRNDLMQPGVVDIRYFYNTNLLYSLWAAHMDRIQEVSLTYKTRISKFMTLETSLRRYDIFANNNYEFVNTGKDTGPGDHFSFSEAGLKWRWAYKEKISSNFGNQISVGSDYPVLLLSYGKGLDGVLGGRYDYNRFEFGTWLYRYFKGWGFLDTRIEAGFVDQALPYQLLFSNRATYSSRVSFISTNTFQTMRYNEFFSDRYVSFFLYHNFGSLLFRLPNFSPEITLSHAMSFGDLQHPEYHQNLDIRTLEHGYYESGLIISNIFRFSLLKAGYLGLGFGTFYRYGPYQLPTVNENLAHKISVIYTIN